MAIKLKLNDSGDFEVEKGLFLADACILDEPEKIAPIYKSDISSLVRRFGPVEVVEQTDRAVFLAGPWWDDNLRDTVSNVVCDTVGWRVIVWSDPKEGI